jgi:hypothetical protein
MYERTQFLILFAAIETITNQFVEDSQETGASLLWKARFSQTYSSMLTSVTVHLQDASLDCYSRYISELRQAMSSLEKEQLTEAQRNLSLVLSEYSHCLINFWKYEACEEAMLEALSLLGLEVYLDGRMGKRTKYQHWDVA